MEFSLGLVILGVGWWWYGRRLAVRVLALHPGATLEEPPPLPRGMRWLKSALLGLAVSALVAVLWDPFCAWLPLWVQGQVRLLLWVGATGALAMFAGFVVTVAYRTGHAQARPLALAAALLSVAFLTAAHRLNAPIVDQVGDRTTPGGMVLQSTPWTCTAASLANVARRCGIHLGEREAAGLLGTSRCGSSPGQLRFALGFLGIPHEDVRLERPDPAKVPVPAILFVDHPTAGREGHAIALLGRHGDVFEILDPALGRLLWTRDDAAEIWHGRGIACRTPPGP